MTERAIFSMSACLPLNVSYAAKGSLVDSKTELLSIFEKFEQALFDCDADSLRQMIADDYRGFDPQGQPQGKNVILEAYRPGGVKLDAYDVEVWRPPALGGTLMKRTMMAAFVAVTVFVCVPSARAEQANYVQHDGWFCAGLGGGSVSGGETDQLFERLSVVLSGNVAFGANAISARFAKLGFGESDGDVAVLFRRSMVAGQVELSAAAGPGMLYRRYGTITDGPDDEVFDRAGIAWAAEIIKRSISPAAIGLAGFGEVAGSRSFWGMALLLCLGR